MIKGITHDQDGSLHKITKYRGKISTGYSPKEPPNTHNSPMAAGFFRMLKEVNKTEKIGASQKVVTKKEWILNQKVQDKLEESLSTGKERNKTPRRIEIVCLYRTPAEMWESSLSMYSSSDGLLCKSYGLGTNARYLEFTPDGERKWTDRLFNGIDGCAFDKCQDYISKKCKPVGIMKCFPTIDMTPNPYRFETRSINTITGIESALHDAWTLVNAAHVIREREAGKSLNFEGLFGHKFYLLHKKVKSGGREVFITDLMPTQEFIDLVMQPIRRGLDMRHKTSNLIGSQGSMSLLQQAGNKLLEAEDAQEVSEETDMDLDAQREIAVNFGADSDSDGDPEVSSATIVDGEKTDSAEIDASKAAAENLLNDNNDSPKKQK